LKPKVLMSGLVHWLPSHDSLTGTFALVLWAAGVVTALFIVIGAMVFREFGVRGMFDVFVRGAAVVIAAALAWAWLDYSVTREQAAERRALDARTAELTARAIAPGSALSCLDAVDNEAVESACLQAVFASPQAVAAAVAYVDARLKLLADGLDYASRDKSYSTALEAPRRALQADRYGVVAHVLAGRGCNADDCVAFKLLGDPTHVRANLTDRYFEVHVASHSANWQSDNGATATPAVPIGPAAPATTSALPSPGGPYASKFTFPSASSIPPVSIMNAEPIDSATPSGSASEPKTPGAARRQTANKPPPGPAKPLPPPPSTAPRAQ
jgi:hypothetical protein